MHTFSPGWWAPWCRQGHLCVWVCRCVGVTLAHPEVEGCPQGGGSGSPDSGPDMAGGGQVLQGSETPLSLTAHQLWKGAGRQCWHHRREGWTPIKCAAEGVGIWPLQPQPPSECVPRSRDLPPPLPCSRPHMFQFTRDAHISQAAGRGPGMPGQFPSGVSGGDRPQEERLRGGWSPPGPRL